MNVERLLPHLVVSGPLCAGKTTIGELLAAAGSFEVVSVRALIRELAAAPLSSRRELQEFGNQLESETHGQWLADYLALRTRTSTRKLLVDAVRTTRQVEAARAVLRPHVAHLHLTAEPAELARRFTLRRDLGIDDAATISQASSHDVEIQANDLGTVADFVIDTTGKTAPAVTAQVRQWLAASTAEP